MVHPMKTAIQLSLFPHRGFGLASFGELLIDSETGLPLVTDEVSVRRFAKTVRYLQPKVVRVEVHEATTDDDLPTFMVV
jgi:hypothetical protein